MGTVYAGEGSKAGRAVANSSISAHPREAVKQTGDFCSL
jgi:hypothetical protein